MPPLAPSTGADGSEGLIIARLRVRRCDLPRNQRPNETLLLGDAARGADHFQAIFVDDAIILVQYLALEQAEALDRIVAPAEIHTCLIEFELYPPRHQPVERHVDRHTKIEDEVWLHRKAVQLADPLAIDAARRIARERRVRVAVGEHDHARLE